MRGGNCPGGGGNCLGGNCPRWQFSGGKCPGDNYLGGNCPGEAIVQGEIVLPPRYQTVSKIIGLKKSNFPVTSTQDTLSFSKYMPFAFKSSPF